MPPRRHACSAPPEVRTSMPPRLHTNRALLELQRPIPPCRPCRPCLHVTTPTMRLPEPQSPRAPEPQSPRASSSPHLQRASMPLHLHVITPAAYLESSMLHTSMLLCLQVCRTFPTLHTSVHPRHYAWMAALELRTSIHSPLRVAAPSTRLHSSRVPYFHIYSSTRLQRVSRASELHASMSLRLAHRTSRPPEFHASESRHQECSCGALELRSSMPPRLHACSTSSAFHASIPPRQHAGSTPYLHVCMLAVSLKGSRPPYLYASTPPYHDTCSTLPDLHTSMLPRPHACSAAPDLQTYRPPCFHACTPAVHLQHSISMLPVRL